MTNFARYRVLWPDHLGLARGKYLPARVADRGTAFCVGTFLLGYDREIYEVECGMDPTGFPDVDARYDIGDARAGWEPGTGVLVTDLTKDGALYPVAARTALRKAIADWKALGYTAKVGIELEAYIMEPDGNGGWQPFNTPSAFVYGTGPFTDPTGLIDELMLAAEASNLPVETFNSEFDFPQFELTLEYGNALEAIDNIFLFKELARETALAHGLLLTFIDKPITDKSGSGVHINFSMTDDDGNNAFVDTSTHDGLSNLARQCIAGLLAHHEGMSALLAPTVNSHKRLRPGGLAGYWANWGYDHRVAAVRIPPHRGSATRIEQRTGGGTANPYIATAAVLQAALLGVTNDLPCPEPETGDGFESINTERHVPDSMSAGLDALEADTELSTAIGQALVDNFVGIKRHEWDSYVAATPDWETKLDDVTPWELDTYLPFH
ncbi:MAG: glutamine synthetase family protein [Acidimicrobiales bacterium]